MHFDWTFLVRMSALVLPAIMLMAVHGAAAHAASPSTPATGVPLEKLPQQRIFFGHQSVGGNILDGVKQVAPAVRVVEVKAPTETVAPGTIAHAMVGQNEKPESKIADFERLVDGGMAKGADVAFFKFCYIDFNGATDARALFEKYRAMMDGLQARHPGTTFVHVTVPLTTVQRGAKAWLKELLGRPVWGITENVQRETFNQLLRKTYGGKAPLFDLAALESTGPDGTAETYELNGETWPAMSPAYSDDGGHLNAAGQARIAKEFLTFLSTLPAPAVQPPIPAVQTQP
ncbi:SGNH/GDSL hydrolase family protein [Myxococcus sp. RHSTA-1-4]|uniref:SGNH/GDSL hydrolase family protein n=1 Tax=Myxococcus sp. RHSTA-1-4 TaxID=2874601 RepID=UPI001CBDB581|nr:SGNH/GDSL hydrolase family protein [Myxococcus sp. RHSTA-1-4]MBZ4415683.1 SGNH/GDSL hydrolase family protein [Myxococcus sp. RHSTA-1-4]